METNWNRKLGTLGEDLAVAYLKRCGYEILERNYRCRYGEIDIIGRKKGVIDFIEVKTRTGSDYGSPGEAIDHKKMQKIRATAREYLFSSGITGTGYGFHAIEISLRHLEDLWT